MEAIEDLKLKEAILKECKNVPLSHVTSVSRARNTKKRKLLPKPVTQLARDVTGYLTGDPPGDVVISNPHDVAAVYVSGCYGKSSLSKGAPDGWFVGSEELIISPCEALYLIGLKALVVLENEHVLSQESLWHVWQKHNPNFSEEYVVYKHFRDKGYTVRSGIKYGGEFVLYSGDPNTTHAAYVVKVVGEREQPPWTAINGLRRVSESVAKECVLAYVSFRDGYDATSPECSNSGSVTLVLLKRWIPERDREIGGKT